MNPTLKLYLWCAVVLTAGSFIILIFMDLGTKFGNSMALLTVIVGMTILMVLTGKMEEIEEQEKKDERNK